MLSGSDFSWFFPAKPIRWYWSSFVARVFLEVTDHPGRHHFQTPWALAMGRQAPRHSVSAGCTLNFKHPQQRWCHDKLRAPHHCPAISNIGYLGHERTPPGIASSWLTGFFRMLRKTRWSWQMTRNAVCNKRPSPSKRKTRKNAAEKNKRGKKDANVFKLQHESLVGKMWSSIYSWWKNNFGTTPKTDGPRQFPSCEFRCGIKPGTLRS